VVYRNPKDFPGKWVVRRRLIYAGFHDPDMVVAAVTDSLLAARAAIPLGLVCVPRHWRDDPVIWEYWA
jgi:hypothetical protein